MKEELIVKKLIEQKETISSMESCTSGYFATSITNVSGSSEVLKFSAITYSNEYKIKFGVKSETIEKYSVYSNEVSREMSKCIHNYTGSTYSVGITGQINRVDPNNPYGKDNLVYASIYDSKNDKYYDLKITCPNKERLECKKYIVDKVMDEFINILKA